MVTDDSQSVVGAGGVVGDFELAAVFFGDDDEPVDYFEESVAVVAFTVGVTAGFDESAVAVPGGVEVGDDGGCWAGGVEPEEL